MGTPQSRVLTAEITAVSTALFNLTVVEHRIQAHGFSSNAGCRQGKQEEVDYSVVAAYMVQYGCGSTKTEDLKVLVNVLMSHDFKFHRVKLRILDTWQCPLDCPATVGPLCSLMNRLLTSLCFR